MGDLKEESRGGAVRPTRLHLAANALAGASLGLFIGLLMGLTTTGVAAAVVTGLVALLATFLGLNAGSTGIPGATSLVRIAAFALAAMVGALVGLSARTHQWFAPSLGSIVAEARQLQDLRPETRELVTFLRYGIVPKDASVTNEGAVAAARGVLYSAATDVECNLLSETRAQTPEKRLAAMVAHGGQLADTAARIGKLAPQRQAVVIDAASFYLCGIDP